MQPPAAESMPPFTLEHCLFRPFNNEAQNNVKVEINDSTDEQPLAFEHGAVAQQPEEGPAAQPG